MSDVVLTVDMDKRCAECGKPGATGSGLCLKCATKALDPDARMKSPEGQAVRARYREKMLGPFVRSK